MRSWLRRLAAAEHRSERIRRLACWRSWFADSYCHSLAAAVRELREADITPPVVQLRAARATSRPLTRQQVHRADKHTQRAVGELLRERQRRCPEARMRKKLEKWEVPLFPRLRAQRAVVALQRLATLAPPRVGAAVLRTWWSGWCTSRRFGGCSRCIFCRAEAQDSVEHASVCRALAIFGRDHLRLPYLTEVGERRLNFLLLEHRDDLPDRRLLLGALRIAAAYRLHCQHRRRPAALHGEGVAQRALAQAARELVMGHPKAIALYDGRWRSS